jgi:hypothetical protein
MRTTVIRPSVVHDERLRLVTIFFKSVVVADDVAGPFVRAAVSPQIDARLLAEGFEFGAGGQATA